MLPVSVAKAKAWEIASVAWKDMNLHTFIVIHRLQCFPTSLSLLLLDSTSSVVDFILNFD